MGWPLDGFDFEWSRRSKPTLAKPTLAIVIRSTLAKPTLAKPTLAKVGHDPEFSCRFVSDDAIGMPCTGHVGEGLDRQVWRSLPPPDVPSADHACDCCHADRRWQAPWQPLNRIAVDTTLAHLFPSRCAMTWEERERWEV